MTAHRKINRFISEKYLSNMLLYIIDLRDMALTEASFLDL